MIHFFKLLIFLKYPYPKKEQYEDYAKEIDETAAKVENWFKYQRRTYKTTGIIKDFKVIKNLKFHDFY